MEKLSRKELLTSPTYLIPVSLYPTLFKMEAREELSVKYALYMGTHIRSFSIQVSDKKIGRDGFDTEQTLEYYIHLENESRPRLALASDVIRVLFDHKMVEYPDFTRINTREDLFKLTVNYRRICDIDPDEVYY